MISVADDALIFEVDSIGTTLWDYEFPINNSMIARAQKYSVDFLGGDDSDFPEYRLGDINFDTEINIFDLLYTVDMVTLPDSYYQPTPPADINEDSTVNNLDIFAFVASIMQY